ncbi:MULTISPECIES: hypothetical protein [unclassified Burkholderia]|uniref:hypothetical protein n=1 Tax=unclassified Burkholderia TaxID=2613784 RepID=UPI0016284588|nr:MULTISPECIES: hypothetical protein [unclassified Burkholderia]
MNPFAIVSGERFALSARLLSTSIMRVAKSRAEPEGYNMVTELQRKAGNGVAKRKLM